MSLVAMKDIVVFLGLDTETIADKNLGILHTSIEAWVDRYCGRAFSSTSYKERYDGTGTQELILDYHPIISLNRLCIGTNDGINIKNTNSSFHASVSINGTTLTLYKDGATSTLALATYTTLATLIAAINLLSGWQAELVSSSYSSYPSNVLQEQFGLQCINNRWVSLQIPDEGEDDFEVYPNEGRIFLWAGFPEGHRNVYVEYTAGYATIPEDLKLAILILIKYFYQRRVEESFGVTSYSLAGVSATFEAEGIPKQASDILHSYSRLLLSSS